MKVTRTSTDTYHVISRHQFTKQRIKILLPLSMIGILAACGISIPPQIRPMEIVGFCAVVYIAISAFVPICEVDVTSEGLVIRRILLPKRHIPWSAIDRVLIFMHKNAAGKTTIEITSIGMYEGLSAINRLPGILYGQGLRQTVVVTPDSIKGYYQLIECLSSHCAVFRSQLAA